MKKLILGLWVIVLLLFWTQSFAATDHETCMKFEYWKVCLDIQNNYNWSVTVKRSYTAYKRKDITMINCKLLLPNWKLKDLWTCNKTFEFDYQWNGEVEFTVYVEWETKRSKYTKYFSSLLTKELNSIKSLNKNWTKVESTLKQRFPKLKTNKTWNILTQTFWQELLNISNWKQSKFESYADVYNALKEFVIYTSKQIK